MVPIPNQMEVMAPDTFTATALYNQPSSLATIAGNWTGNLKSDTGADVLNISSSGVIFVQGTTGAGDCIINGQVSLINPAHNVYVVQWTFSGAGCDLDIKDQTASGIGYVDSSVSPAKLEIAVSIAGLSGTYVALYDEAAN